MADFISFDNGKTDDGTFDTPLCGLSIGLAVARHLYSAGGSLSRCRVRISAIPSRKLGAADS